MGNGNIYQNKQQYSTCCVYHIDSILLSIYKYPSAFIHARISNVNMYILIYVFHIFSRMLHLLHKSGDSCFPTGSWIRHDLSGHLWENNLREDDMQLDMIFSLFNLSDQWLVLVPLKGVIGYLLGGYILPTKYHLLREPETTIDQSCDNPGPWVPDNEGVYPVQPSIFRGELAVSLGAYHPLYNHYNHATLKKKCLCKSDVSKLVGGWATHLLKIFVKLDHFPK